MAGNLNVGSINDVGFMPINLAINPEFTINQRGAASPTAATGYNYDRWYYDGSSLLQGIENLNLRTTTYVVSWEGSATCSYSLNAAASSSQGSQTFTSITNGGTLTISSLGSNNLWLKFSGTVSDLTNVMCVPSPAQTPFVPRQHQQELALCQRYYISLVNPIQYQGATGYSTNRVLSSFMFPTVMRATPSVGFSGTCYFFSFGGANSTTTPTLGATSSGSGSIDAAITVSAGTSGVVALAGTTTLSAEL